MTRTRHPLDPLIAVIGLIAFAGAVVGSKRTPPNPPRMPVTVIVDFGPAGKPTREAHLEVDKGSTPKDVVSLLFPIQSGSTCCNTRELAAIDGVRSDPETNRWWSCRLNGSTKLSPFRTELKPNDRVEWTYADWSQ